MRASLARYVDAIGASFRDKRDAASTAHVDNVQTTTGFVGKICNLLYVAFPGYVGEVEVYKEYAFIRIGSNPVKIGYLFECLAGEGYGFSLQHPTRGNCFLAGSYQVEVPTCLG